MITVQLENSSKYIYQSYITKINLAQRLTRVWILQIMMKIFLIYKLSLFINFHHKTKRIINKKTFYCKMNDKFDQSFILNLVIE